jgi:hypothetical protein
MVAFGMQGNRAPNHHHKESCKKWKITFDVESIIGSQDTKNADRKLIIVSHAMSLIAYFYI